MERYIVSDTIQQDIQMYCFSRQGKRNPCKRCKFGIGTRFGIADCMFTRPVVEWKYPKDKTVCKKCDRKDRCIYPSQCEKAIYAQFEDDNIEQEETILKEDGGDV